MDHRYFRYDAYSWQNHDVEQGGVSPESSHTGADSGADFGAGSAHSYSHDMSAVLQGLEDLQIGRRSMPIEDGPRIGRSSFAGYSSRMGRRVNREEQFSSMRFPGGGMWRADTPPPRDVTEHGRLLGHVDAQVTRHSGADLAAQAGSLSAPVPRRRRSLLARAGSALGRMLGAGTSRQQPPPPTGRRRSRNEAGDAAARWIAGTAMRAEETTLARPDFKNHPDPHENDFALIERARQGLATSEGNDATKQFYVKALTRFSAWLVQVGKDDMQSRIFSEELISDAVKFAELGGSSDTVAALGHLREMESSTHGTTEIPTRPVTREWDAPEADRRFIELAFNSSLSTTDSYRKTKRIYMAALLSFSEWLARSGLPGLSDSNWLNSDGVLASARQCETPGGRLQLVTAINHLRTYELTGVTNVKRRRQAFDMPLLDQPLIARYEARTLAQLEATAEATGQPVSRDKAGKTKVEKYASRLRAFSSWLRSEQRESIAALLHVDDARLEAELELFAEGKSSSFRAARVALREMRAMFPPQAPELAIARIGAERFVQALGMLAAHADVAEVARHTGASESDLRLFLDEYAESGMTQAGHEVVGWFDGGLRQAANANVQLLRTRQRGPAGQYAGQPSTQTPSPHYLSPMPSDAWPQFSSPNVPGYGPGPSDTTQPGSGSILGSWSALDSTAHYGSAGFEAGGLSEVTGPSRLARGLSEGPVPGTLRRFLTTENVEMGFASGAGLNCLLDSVLQLAYNLRRPVNGQTPMPQLDQSVQEWRAFLSTEGVVDRYGQIDLYGANGVGVTLAHSLRIRIQAIEVEANGGVTVHPILGQEADPYGQRRLVHILHTPGHFQPLWPK